VIGQNKQVCNWSK